jgi:hypothetical protein
MFKKIMLAVLMVCISASSYAYVSTNLLIVNKTNVDMVLTAKQPNNQEDITLVIPVNTMRYARMTDGLGAGWLYQSQTASFKIGEKGKNDEISKLYIKGRVAYYTGSAYWNRYAFLDAVSVADGLKADLQYSCVSPGYSLANMAIDNVIVIEGTPGNILVEKDFPQQVMCRGLKSSVLAKHEDPSTPQYTPTCFDGRTTSFWGKVQYEGCGPDSRRDPTGESCSTWIQYTNSETGYYTNVWIHDVHVDSQRLQTELDKQVGNPYCQTWSFK